MSPQYSVPVVPSNVSGGDTASVILPAKGSTATIVPFAYENKVMLMPHSLASQRDRESLSLIPEVSRPVNKLGLSE